MNSLQQALDSVKISKDESLEIFKRKEIIKDSGIIVNGSIAIVGGTGSGKTTLITKLLKIYVGALKNCDIIYFGTEIDQTFSKNISMKITLVNPAQMKDFLEKYASDKKLLIELIEIVKLANKRGKKLRTSDLTENMIKIAKELRQDNVDDLAAYALDKVAVTPLKYSICIFDDITQLGKFTSDPAGKFLRMITANTRHFLNTSIFSMQRYTYLPSNVRKNINCWIFTKGITQDDLKIMLQEIVLPADVDAAKVIKTVEELQKYEFLVINSETNTFTVVKT